MINTHKCRVCGITKVRIFLRQNKDYSKVYEDDKGNRWCSNTCPACKRKRDSATAGKRKAQYCANYLRKRGWTVTGPE